MVLTVVHAAARLRFGIGTAVRTTGTTLGGLPLSVMDVVSGIAVGTRRGTQTWISVPKKNAGSSTVQIKKRGRRKPAFDWADRHWSGGECGTVVLLEETDAVEAGYDRAALPFEDGNFVKIMCPVCGRMETYYPSHDPGSVP